MMVNILFWIFVSAFTLLVPGVMIFFGREFMKNPPGEINPGYGYRTSMSSKNRVLVVPTAVALLSVLGQDVGTVGMAGMIACGVQLVVMLGSIAVTERALRKNFDKNGKRKTETD